jgi:hypothetical protein
MQCHRLGYLQQLGNYFRVRHYDGINPITGKSRFSYHQQSKEWVKAQQDASKDSTALPVTGQECDQTVQVQIDPDRLKSSLKYGLNQSGRRLVGLGLKPSKLAIPGSNPGDRTKQGF